MYSLYGCGVGVNKWGLGDGSKRGKDRKQVGGGRGILGESGVHFLIDTGCDLLGQVVFYRGFCIVAE